MSNGTRLNMPLLLKSIRLVETSKLGIGDVCRKLGVDPATFFRLRQAADTHLGLHFDVHNGGTLYIASWGLLNPARTRHAARSRL